MGLGIRRASAGTGDVMYEQTIPQLTRALTNLEVWLDEAVAHAETEGLDPESFVEARLAPDMFPLRRQIQSLCDAAKFIPARLTGREAPVQADDETTLAELRARIAWTRAYLATFSLEDFEGAHQRTVRMGMLPEGLGMRSTEYLRGFALPNFYFHCVTAYGILRHCGVPLGKRKYIGHIELIPV